MEIKSYRTSHQLAHPLLSPLYTVYLMLKGADRMRVLLISEAQSDTEELAAAILACGYTPVSTLVERWQERFTPARMLPHRTAKWLALLAWPWATFAESSYQRHWDETTQSWRQAGRHRQKVSGIEVKTEALIVPQLGGAYITGEVAGSRYTMQASHSFQRPDIGVPAWEAALTVAASLTKFL